MSKGRSGLLGTASVLSAALAIAGASVAALPAHAQSASSAWANTAGYDGYEWIDRAQAISDAVGDAPPDYSFDFASGGDSSRPWAWTLQDGSTLILEQRDDGPHFYYFGVGDDGPFLARAPDMSFAFLQGRLAAVYDEDGTLLDRNAGGGWIDDALDDWRRGRALRRAMLRGDRRGDVQVAAWYDFSTYFLFDFIRHWDDGRRRNPHWRRHHDRPKSAIWRKRYDGEHRRRKDVADRFNRWRQGGFQGQPPGRWQRPPVGWNPGRPGNGEGRPGGPGRPGRPRPDGNPPPLPPVEGPRTLPAPVTGAEPQPNLPPRPDAGVRPRPRPGRPDGPRPQPRPIDPGSPIELTEPQTGPVPPARPDRPRWPRPDGVRPIPRNTGVVPPPAVPAPPAPVYVPPPAPVSRPDRPDRPRGDFGRPRQPDTVRPRPSFSPPTTPPPPSYTPPARTFSPPPSPPPAPVRVRVAPPPPPPAPRVYSPPPPPPPPPPAPPPPSAGSRFEPRTPGRRHD
jgi:hypothetical protein